MSRKVVIFKSERGDFCVMNVPEHYRRLDAKPPLDGENAYPRFFSERAEAVAEARARHGRMALVIDETH